MLNEFTDHDIKELNLPIYITLANGQCRPPARLALGDSLMVLGLLRNYGRPVELFFNPMPALLPLLQNHPLIKTLHSPEADSDNHLHKVPQPRSGRPATWQAKTNFLLPTAKAPIDQVKANPILAHSLYYKLPRQEDWPSIMLDNSANILATMLSKNKPSLLLFPFNPGRADANWQDEDWWLELSRRLKPDFHLIAVGANNYGLLSREMDALLPMSAPESTLMNLAWLAQKAHGFIGRDGGLAHLASAVNRNLVIIWDSMSSYRYWAGRRGHHVLLSNPVLFRFPQRLQMNLDFLLKNYRQISYVNDKGQSLSVHMPTEPAAYQQQAIELFGSMENLHNIVASSLEQKIEQQAVRGWMSDSLLKNNFYKQSQDFTIQAINCRLAEGKNWVAPYSPD